MKIGRGAEMDAAHLVREQFFRLLGPVGDSPPLGEIPGFVSVAVHHHMDGDAQSPERFSVGGGNISGAPDGGFDHGSGHSFCWILYLCAVGSFEIMSGTTPVGVLSASP